MSTSVDGNSQSGSSKKTRVSDKPWHMTWNESTKQLFIWKSGRRLYIGDGVSAGPASAIESIDKHAVKVWTSYLIVYIVFFRSVVIGVCYFIRLLENVKERHGKPVYH